MTYPTAMTIALSDMIEYIKTHKGVSYYDIKEMAYAEDKKDWISILESNKRVIIAEICKEQRRKIKTKYNRSYQEAYLAALDAEIAYNKKIDT